MSRNRVPHWQAGLVFVATLILVLMSLPPKSPAIAAPSYTAWNDRGIVYSAPSGSAYYPSILYDANGFGGANSLYKMWYSDGATSSHAFVVTSTTGISWTTPITLTGLGSYVHHVQVLYDANCFGISCGTSDPRYRIWYWNGSDIYTITAMSTARSVDGIDWTDRVTLTQSATSPLATGAGVGWNRGTYGPIYLFYQPGASNTGNDPWSYSYVMYYDATDGSHEVTALAYSTDGILWMAYPGNPVLDHGDSGDWDGNYATYGTVIYSGGMWHYWYGGGVSAAHEGIGYASSLTGTIWTKDINNPIFKIAGAPAYRDLRVYTPAVIDDGSGILKMYYSAQGSVNPNKRIGLATTQPITAFVDDDWRGLGALTQVTFTGDPNPHWIGLDAFATITEGVNAVTAGGAVHVASGTYTEQVTISKTLSLLGVGAASVTIQEPTTLAASEDCGGAATNRTSLVTITGAGVRAEVAGFNFHGLGGTALNVGLYVRGGAYGNIHDNTFSDLGTGDSSLGILVGRGSCSTTGTATIASNTVGGYGKGGVVVDNTGSSATIITNTITGMDATDTIAQNGIQVSRGATATIAANTINNHICTSSSGGCADDPSSSLTADGAAGILLYNSGSGVAIRDNALDGNQFGIWAVAAVDAAVSDNTITGTLVNGITTTGIAVWDADQWASYFGYTEVGTTANIIHNAVSAHGYGLLARDYRAGGAVPVVRAWNNSFSNDSVASVCNVSGTATIAGNQLYTNTIVFSQTGGTLSAYANNIGNFTTGVAISNGAFDGRHNWWGSNDPNATKPGGLDDADWQVRLGAPVKTWADSSGNASLEDSSNGRNAIISGGSGTAVIVSHGRALTATQAPFSNGVIGHVDQMCSDFYDFFTVGGGGAWSVSVPVDSASDCDETYNRGFIYTIPPTTTYSTECSPSTNPACWRLVAANVITGGRSITVANLSVGDLGGTPFVAGDVHQHNPTTVTLVNFRSAPARLDESLPVLLLGCGLIGGSAVILRRRWRAQRAQ